MNPVNMRMHVNDEGQYKTLHPETNADQVILTSGNLQNHLDSTVPIKIEDNTIKFLNPSTGNYENYSSDSLALSPLGKITNLTSTVTNDKAVVKWNDPSDVTIDTNVKSVTIAKWKGTKLVMKIGSVPVDENDGTIIVDSTIKNQYSSTGFTANSLVYGTTYYIKAFPYTEAGIVTNSNDSVVSFTPVLPKIGDVLNPQIDTAGSTIYLRWTDPNDVVVDGTVVTRWAGTKVVVKANSYPTSSTDGTLLIDSRERNKYVSTSFAKEKFSEGTYYVGFFPYTDGGIETVSVNRVSVTVIYTLPSGASNISVTSNQGTATIKWASPAEKTKIVFGSNVIIDKWQKDVLVRKAGSYPKGPQEGTILATITTRDQYKLNGYVDNNLVNGTTYYYTVFTTSTDYLLFSTDIGSTTIRIGDDLSGSPGPSNLVAGDKTAGYYGYVDPSLLITGSALSSQVGYTAGVAQFNDQGWLKFHYGGKIIFVAKKPFRYSTTWDSLNAANLVYGNKTIVINGLTYKVRLMRGAINDPSSASKENMANSEWNRLMLPIHVRAKDGSWDDKRYIGDSVPYWGIDFTGDDLAMNYSTTPGANSWCQETSEQYDYSACIRGGYGDPSYVWFHNKSQTMVTTLGWRPVLELVQ